MERLGHFRVFGAEQPSPHGEHFTAHRLRAGIVAAIKANCRKTNERTGHVDVLCSEHTPAKRQCLAEHCLGLLVLAELPIDDTERVPQLGFNGGLVLEVLAEPLAGLVEDLPEQLRVAAQCHRRADALQHVRQKLGDLFAFRGLGLSRSLRRLGLLAQAHLHLFCLDGAFAGGLFAGVHPG